MADKQNQPFTALFINLHRHDNKSDNTFLFIQSKFLSPSPVSQILGFQNYTFKKKKLFILFINQIFIYVIIIIHDITRNRQLVTMYYYT